MFCTCVGYFMKNIILFLNLHLSGHFLRLKSALQCHANKVRRDASLNTSNFVISSVSTRYSTAPLEVLCSMVSQILWNKRRARFQMKSPLQQGVKVKKEKYVKKLNLLNRRQLIFKTNVLWFKYGKGSHLMATHIVPLFLVQMTDILLSTYYKILAEVSGFARDQPLLYQHF